ncbi:hydrolase [Chlamydia sp. 12-01]|uniref:hydrolase n=1 Tax=Chlamydia sp. 12-01 TaxID=3002742 RepID=UPI0035D426A7
MKNITKDIKAQISGKVIPENQIQFSCGGDGVSENAMRKPWDVSNQRIVNITRGSGTPPTGSIVLKSDLGDYLQKGDVTTTGTFLRTTGGLMIGNIDMGSANTVVGLPTSYKTTVVNDTDMASVGMVAEDIGSLADKVIDLIDRINALTSKDGLSAIIKDMGTPTGSDGTISKPTEAKWLVRKGGNSMQGNLGFQKSEQSTPTDPDPTIQNLSITGSTANTVTVLGAISTGTTKENLQRIVAVKDVLETLSTIKTNTMYPEWTGMEVSFVCLKQTNSGSSSVSYEKSKNSEQYITTTSETSATLLRRGVYCISFIYDFTQPTPPVPPPGTPTPPTDVSCILSLTPTGGTKTECYRMTGKSDNTLIGKTYVFVEGTQASISTTLSFDVTSTPTVAKQTWTVSFVGAAY